MALVVALCFVAGVVGYWIGNPADDDDSFNAVDVGFLADMSAHHNGAIAMSFELMGRGDDPWWSTSRATSPSPRPRRSR